MVCFLSQTALPVVAVFLLSACGCISIETTGASEVVNGDKECVLGENSDHGSSSSPSSCFAKEEDSAPVCADSDERCPRWGEIGECEKNPNYMLKSCRRTCQTCDLTTERLTALIERKAAKIKKANDDEVAKNLNMKETRFGVKQDSKASQDPKEQIRTTEMIANTTKYMEEVVFRDSKYAQVRSECKNRHPHCAFWAIKGECDVNPAYMTLQCAPSCQSCHLIDFDTRCPLDPHEPYALAKPGDLHELFLNLTTLPEYLPFEPNILSMPKALSTGQNHIPDGPWVVTLDSFLTDEECDRLIYLGGQEGYEVSRDVGKRKFDGSYDGKQNDCRTSTNAWCKDACFEDAITQRVLQKIENITGIPDKNSEYLQLLRYEEGQFYKTHHDYIPHHTERQEGVRILTVFLYLNDVEEGGGTDFPKLGLTVMPKRGKALIWPSVLDSEPNKKDFRTDHQALPVQRGIKYGANAWIHQRDFKDPFKRGCH